MTPDEPDIEDRHGAGPTTRGPVTDADVAIVVSFDNAFAVAAAALIASIERHLDRRYRATIYVLDDSVKADTKRKLRQIAPADRVSLQWISFDRIRNARIWDTYVQSRAHYPPAAYSRLIIGDLLPESLNRVLYLDTDILVRADLARLFHSRTDGSVALAAIDPLVAAPGSLARCGYPAGPTERALQYGDYLERLLREAGERHYAFSSRERYFQSGVLLIDLEAYRGMEAGPRLIDLTTRYPEFLFPDQDALNVVLRGRIGTLDPRWNMVGTLYGFSSHAETPYDSELFQSLLSDPWIVHFTSRPKPWHLGCTHPFLQEWYEALDRTPWQGWRPTRTNQILARVPRGRRLLAKKLRKAFSRAPTVQ